MVIDGSQILMKYNYVLVKPDTSDAIFFIPPSNSKNGTVIDVWQGCDWVFADDVIAYKADGVQTMRFDNIIYDLVPQDNILFTYIASLA